MTRPPDHAAPRPTPSRRRRIAIGLVLSVCGVWMFHAATPPEPAYRGIPLRQWLGDFDSHSLYLKQEASEATTAFGASAVPTLVRLLERRDSSLKQWAVALAARQSFIRVRHTPAALWHLRAMKACRVLGPLARPAVPALIDLLEDPEIGHEAAATLADVEPDLFPLARAVTNQAFSAEARARAARRLGAPAYARRESVVSALTIAQEDPVAKVRRAAAVALRKHARYPREPGPLEWRTIEPSPHQRPASQTAPGHDRVQPEPE